MNRTILAAVAFTTAFAALATTEDQTLYVDKAAAAGGDGETMETAFNTIAAAVAKAQTDWKVLVAPGVYDTEEVVDDFGYTNRVYINKRIHLKSTGGKDVTHIVGKWAKESIHDTFPGIGPDAVRCIQMGAAAYYSVIEGFTIRDGACHTANDDISGYGGGVVGKGTSYFVVDCVVSNCVAVRGGALRDVTAVRSWITRNTGGTAAGRRVNFVNCLITANYGTGGAFMDNMLINCTVAGNPVTPLIGNIASGYKFYNCVFANNVNLPSANTPVTADGCVFNSGSTPGFLSNANTSLGNSATRWDGFDYNFFAPLVNDWRLLATSQAIGRGNASHLSNSALYVRDNVDYHKDFAGNAIPSTGTINAGCIQTPGPTPAGGAVQFAGPSIANGETSGGVDLYAFSETYPAQFKVKPILAANERPVYVERSPAAEYDLFPQMDDSVWVVTPPAGIVQTNTFVVTTNIVYVSPTGNDSNSGLSPDAPKKTLQAAVDAPTESAVIVAAEGTYDEGGKVQNGVSNRVYISYVARRYIRLVGAGRGKSIIKGAPDPDNPTGVTGDGRGPKACRCVCIGAVAAVQGFTLTDGFSGYDSANPGADNSDGSTRGGAFTINTSGSTRSVNRYLYDCDITSSGANQGGAAYCGTLVRCHISNCITSTRGGIRYARLYSCLVDGTPSDGVSTASLYSGGCTAFQCTFSENDGDGDVVPKSTATPAGNVSGLTNCIMRTKSGKLTASKSSNGANVMDGEATNSTYAQYVVDNGGAYGDSLLKDASAGDYRPISCSPAVGCGALADDFYLRYTSDFNGDAVLFAGGKPTCGAFHTTVQAVIVPSARYGAITSPSSVTNGIDEGETLVVSLANSTRPCAGFEVDGVTNLTDDTTYTFTGGASGALTETVTITPVYLPHWYVDAVNGNDASNGFSRVSAKKTLKGIMDLGNRIYTGDTIHAAEGVYDEGEMEYNSGAVKARVVVPNGVHLVADGKRENTIIEGKTATGGGDDLGNGPGAIRCVVLVNENAQKGSIRGFTLRNGHTLSGNNTTQDYVGGGVYTARNAADALGVRVIDCVITNCCANRGGAGYNRIDYENCLIVGNRAAAAASAMANGAAYGCVFTRNNGNICVYTPYNIVNCTLFGNHNGGSATYDIGNPATGAAVYNTVATGQVTGNSSYYFYASNCVFNASHSSAGQKKFCDETTRWVDESLLAFSPEGAPLSSTHPVVDAAGMSFMPRFDARMDYEKDALGGQRIYNGALDVGAVEYDWRKDFAQMLGGGMASVNVASSSVVTSSVDSVSIRAGELDMTLAGGTGLNVRYTIPVEVVGNGTLTVTNNGVQLAALTSSDGATSLVFKNRLAANNLVFAYDGSDAGVHIGKFGIKVPNLVISFR